MGLTVVRVTASYLNPDGTPAVTGGSVIFALSDEVRDAADGATYGPTPISGTVASTGVLVGSDGNPGVPLVANDDPKAVPSNTTYAVMERLIGVRNPPVREVVVPHANATVNLAALPTAP